ncbi:MAG: hypothetical protein IH898_09655 [Planctomycetes bacterium]|nr:hypothetical protein [Planctomycetota bacterium]
MPVFTFIPSRDRIAKFGALAFWLSSFPTFAVDIPFSGGAAELQQAINDAPENATIVCDSKRRLVISKTIFIKKAITLKGLTARLPEKLGRTQMIVVEAEGVTLSGIELHGNYKTVSQDDRAPLIWLQKSRFTIEGCKFYDATKDGIMVTPIDGAGDIVGGSIRDIEAFRMGRDAVSISGGNKGEKVRNVTVENVRLKVGYLRGAVEVSDGTDNITVRDVYAEDARYAIDVQDHKGDSAANTNIVIEDVEAVNCRHIIRTANSSRGHANPTLRNFTGRNCESPVQISNTKNVTIEGLKLECKSDSKSPPINLRNCQGVSLRKVVIHGLPKAVEAVRKSGCKDVKIEGLSRRL